MFQYLPHRCRFFDERNQAHPPAAPAALVRSHPVVARQLLCPQISRRMSCPRSAAVCAHCLWPGCLALGRQLPASLRRHLRAPRRVRRQHPKVALPMLAWRRYQCRNPIQKLACAQPQFNHPLQPRPVPLQRRPRQPLAHLPPISSPYQPLTGKHRTRTISQQPLAPGSILRCDRLAPLPQCQLKWPAGSRQCVHQITNQLQLLGKHDLYRHRVRRQLYSRARHLHRHEKNSVAVDFVAVRPDDRRAYYRHDRLSSAQVLPTQPLVMVSFGRSGGGLFRLGTYSWSGIDR